MNQQTKRIILDHLNEYLEDKELNTVDLKTSEHLPVSGRWVDSLRQSVRDEDNRGFNTKKTIELLGVLGLPYFMDGSQLVIKSSQSLRFVKHGAEKENEYLERFGGPIARVVKKVSPSDICTNPSQFGSSDMHEWRAPQSGKGPMFCVGCGLTTDDLSNEIKEKEASKECEGCDECEGCEICDESEDISKCAHLNTRKGVGCFSRYSMCLDCGLYPVL